MPRMSAEEMGLLNDSDSAQLQGKYKSSGGWSIIIVLIILTVVNQVVLILRFVVAASSKLGYGFDDVWAVLGYFFLLGNAAVNCWGILQGATGYPPEQATPDQVTTGLLSDYILAWLGTAMLFCVKLSILCLYRRIFISNKFLKFSEWLGIFMGIHLLATGLASGLRCLPFEAVWTQAVDGTTCSNYGLSYGILVSINAAIDMCLLVLPLFMMRQFMFSIKSKIQLSFVFSLGLVMVVAAVFRVTVFVASEPSQDIRVKLHIWAFVEAAVGLICASLPTLRPLAPIIEASRIRSWYSRKSSIICEDTSEASRPSCNSIYYVARQRHTLDLPLAHTRENRSGFLGKDLAGLKCSTVTDISSPKRKTVLSWHDNYVPAKAIEVTHAVDIV